MQLIEHVLGDINNELTIGEQMPHSHALLSLFSGLNSVILLRTNNLANEETLVVQLDTGLQLKHRLMSLPASDQHRLLSLYLDKKGEDSFQQSQVTPDDEVVREERKLRHWFFKAGFIAGCILLCFTIGSVTTILVNNHQLPSNEVLSSLMKTVVDIIKLIFSIGK